MAIRLRSSAADHPRTATAIEQLADLEPPADAEAEAFARRLVPLLERGVAIRVATLGEADPKTTQLKRRLAAACRAAGDAARAEAVEQALEQALEPPVAPDANPPAATSPAP